MIAYRFWYPTISIEGVFAGWREAGIEDSVAVALIAIDPQLVIYTPNSDAPYLVGSLDVKDGPMVIELPPGPFVAAVDDHHQGWIIDMGLPGPDAGKGGKHLLVGPDYDGDLPDGYQVGRSPTYKVLLVLRAMPLGGDLNKAIEALKAVKIYRLADPGTLVAYVDITGKPVNATPLQWEDNFQFWEKLHEVVEAEPVHPEFLPMYGLLAGLGIAKGQPFAPDARMKAILERAAKAGRDQLLVSSFDSARPDRIAWEDRRWEWAGLVDDNGDFRTPYGIDLEARDRWFTQAMAASPAMFRRKVGQGSLYWLAVRDGQGEWLDGSNTYKLAVPQPVPASLFWSVTIYDAETRSQIQTDQNKAALGSLVLKHTPDTEPLDLYFGPQPPAGREDRWIKTIPDKGWFTYFRLFGPEAPAFDGTWRPGDFEQIT